jgi:hypothetical protein
MHWAGVLDVLPRSDCGRRRLFLPPDILLRMLLKFLQTAHCAEVIRLALMLMLPRSPTGNYIHSAHGILRRGFCMLVGLHNREGVVVLMIHTISPVLSSSTTVLTVRICRRRKPIILKLLQQTNWIKIVCAKSG